MSPPIVPPETIGLLHVRPMDGAPEAAPRYRVVSSHSGADFEAGRLNHHNGEAPNDGAKHPLGRSCPAKAAIPERSERQPLERVPGTF